MDYYYGCVMLMIGKPVACCLLKCLPLTAATTQSDTDYGTATCEGRPGTPLKYQEIDANTYASWG